MNEERESIYRSVRAMLPWFALEQPVRRDLACSALAHGTGCKHRDAQWAVYELVNRKILNEEGRYTVWVPPIRALDPELELTPKILDQQRRGIRDVWIKGLQDHNSYRGLPWIVPHLLHYYTYGEQVIPPHRATRPDIVLRLFTAEALTAAGNLQQADLQLTALAQEIESSPGNSLVIFASQLSYIAALGAIHQQHWAEARAHVTTSLNYWCDAHSDYALGRMRSTSTVVPAAVKAEDVLIYLDHPWDALFQLSSLREAVQKVFSDPKYSERS